MGIVVGLPFAYMAFFNPDKRDYTLAGADPHCWAGAYSTVPELPDTANSVDVTTQFENWFLYNFYVFVASFGIMLIAITAIVLKSSMLRYLANFLSFCA
jgi:hypothetical protein